MSPDGTCVRCRREGEALAAREEAVSLGARRRAVLAGTAFAAFVAAAVVFAIQSRGRQVHAQAAAPDSPAANASTHISPPPAPLAPLESANVAPDPSAHRAQAAASPAEAAMRAVPITMYCRASAACAPARAWLTSGGYTYLERNVDADPAAVAPWKAIAPDGAVPAFAIGGQTFEGFDPARIRAALAYAVARRLQP